MDLSISREVVGGPTSSVSPPAPVRNDVFPGGYISPPTNVTTLGGGNGNGSSHNNNNNSSGHNNMGGNNNNNPHHRNSGGSGGGGGGMPLAGRPTIDSIIDARRAANPNEVCFSIPKNCVGAVIGKGGQNLRELSAEYNVRVYIEKEDFNGKRMVVLAYQANPEAGPIDPHTVDMSLRNCQQQIERIVDDQLKAKSNSDPSLENLSVH